jgi:hypothetical protein
MMETIIVADGALGTNLKKIHSALLHLLTVWLANNPIPTVILTPDASGNKLVLTGEWRFTSCVLSMLDNQNVAWKSFGISKTDAAKITWQRA